MKKLLLVLAFVCLSMTSANAEDVATVKERPWYCRLWSNLKATWNSDSIEGLVPVNTWHNRWVYEHEKVHKYNERPWGLGLAKYHMDADGDRHRLGAMVFQDSHDKPEPTFVYSWQYIFRKGKTFRPTLGLMTGITFRDDYDWLPIPAILPVIGLDIGNFSIENTYVPGLGSNNGNVLFTWISWRF